MRLSATLLTICLLAAGAAMAGRQEGGLPPYPYYGPGPESGLRIQDVTERLDRDVQRLDFQVAYGVQNIPEAAAPLQAAQNLIAQARQSLAAGNVPLAINQCVMLENRITELGMLAGRKSMERFRSGGGWGYDTSRQRMDQQTAVNFGIQRSAGRLDYLSSRLESGKNPQAPALIEKARGLLDAARRESAAGRIQNAWQLLSQADPVLNELQRLQQALSGTDTRGTTGPSRDPVKDQQQASLIQAQANYQRVYGAAQRLGERPANGDQKIPALRARVFDLLEKAKEALATGQPEAAKGYCLKAEGVLTEWHRSLAAGDKLSPGARDRVKAKLDLAADVVGSSGNEKAARILEKAREHFERADRGRAEGRAGVAAVEMDLSLKLAAKAVDIARSGSR
jgi:hypothetical protein